MTDFETKDGVDTHELVVWSTDESIGLRSVIAVHSSARGPAFGGCRLWHYPDQTAAERDARRLAEGMSLKNALADLPFGGGKAVIMAPDTHVDRRALFSAFGQTVESLGGRYITAEDVGVTTSDMRVVSETTRHVSGLPRAGSFGGDPSPMTAWGVFVSIDEAVRKHLKRPTLAGTRVAVQGLGAVGFELCCLLADAGCHLIVSDLNPDRIAKLLQLHAVQVVGLDEIIEIEADVFAPCALGSVLDHVTIPRLKVPIVAGAANNQLACIEDGDLLKTRGVLYLPDFLVNAGGIISVAREFLGNTDKTMVRLEVDRIRFRVAELLERAQHSEESTARIAEQWARSKLRPV